MIIDFAIITRAVKSGTTSRFNCVSGKLWVLIYSAIGTLFFAGYRVRCVYMGKCTAALIAIPIAWNVSVITNISNKTNELNPLIVAEVSPFFDDDFSGNWISRWRADDGISGLQYNHQSPNTRPEYIDGEYWMHVVYPAGLAGGGAGTHLVGDLPGGPRDHVVMEYSIRFGDNFEFVKGGKLWGLRGSTDGRYPPGVKPDGTDFFGARLMWRAEGKLIAYVYHPEQPGIWGQDMPLGVQAVRGETYRIRLEIDMNTPGQHDGILRVWVDDVLKLDRADMHWRDVSDLHISQFQMGTFHGGHTADWAPSHDVDAWFGNVKFYSEQPDSRLLSPEQL